MQIQITSSMRVNQTHRPIKTLWFYHCSGSGFDVYFGTELCTHSRTALPNDQCSIILETLHFWFHIFKWTHSRFLIQSFELLKFLSWSRGKTKKLLEESKLNPSIRVVKKYWMAFWEHFLPLQNCLSLRGVDKILKDSLGTCFCFLSWYLLP